MRDDLVYSVNEWDNYAVEEAIQIVEREGGSVTVVSACDPEAEEIVRREMAMGANTGLLPTEVAPASWRGTPAAIGLPATRAAPGVYRRHRPETTALYEANFTSPDGRRLRLEVQ